MSTRYLSLAFCGLALLSGVAQAQQVAPSPTGATNAPAAKAPDVKVDPASQAIADAMVKMDTNDLDGALAKLTEAINLNPNNSSPYVFRASVYCQKKQYAQAEADFKTADRLDPNNVVIKFNLVEVKFMQKQYDAARAGYLPLEKDDQMGDLAAYKVFLCDLFAGHEELAKKERDAFDQIDTQPSYYFSRAAWDLVHKNTDDARGWLVSAANIYPSARIAYYATCLHDMGYLPLPSPADAPPLTH